jgi:hypothetical protein
MKNVILFSTILVVFLSACSPRIQFTQGIKEQHQLSEDELKRIQFYTVGDIVLQRAQSSETEKGTKDGNLVLSSGSSMEQVIIRTGTPGVVEKVISENKIAVRFEQGDGKYLIFGNTQDNKGAYFIVPESQTGAKKMVKYAGEDYALTGNSAYVSLSFKMKTIKRFEKKQRVVKGVKV